MRGGKGGGVWRRGLLQTDGASWGHLPRELKAPSILPCLYNSANNVVSVENRVILPHFMKRKI